MSSRLPLRAAGSATLYSGCSKGRSHRALPQFQQFEIPHKFPRFPQIFGEWIVRRIRKKETGKESGHPCNKPFDTFLDCCRRHPASYEKKCRTEAGKCLACLEEHKNWKAPQAYQYMRFLEYFEVFSEGRQSYDEGPGKFRYTKPEPRTHGSGSVLTFGADPPKKINRTGAAAGRGGPAGFVPTGSTPPPSRGGGAGGGAGNDQPL